jgi:Protein of unknown function (DUF3352)
MRLRRPPWTVLLAFLALLVAGCGGGGGGTETGGGSTPGGASLVRSGVVVFLSLDSDLGSDQWQQVDALSKKFPGRDKALAKIRQSLAKKGVDWERDVDPALGPELDLAIAGRGSAASTKVVGLTKPDDAGKFKALVAKLNASDHSGDDAVYREVDGWYAIADSQDAITQVLKGDRAALADDDSFKAGLGELPGDALAKAYVDGAGVNELIREASAQSGSGLDASTFGLDTLKYVAASASAEDDGVRVHGAAKGGNLGGGTFASKLVDGVPGDAFALLDFRGEGTTGQLDKLKSNPQLGAALKQAEAMIGVSFGQILALLRGEIAFYVRPGAGIPEFTLALGEKDESAALATLDKLAARLAAATGGRVQSGSEGGHPVKTLSFGRFAVHYGGLDGKVLITSGVSGIADYGASGERLPDSADFKEAQDAAGMPDSTGGFLYVNLKDAIPLIEGFMGLAGERAPPEVTENLRPLRSFVAWSEGSGDTRSFDAFLEIK